MKENKKRLNDVYLFEYIHSLPKIVLTFIAFFIHSMIYNIK